MSELYPDRCTHCNGYLTTNMKTGAYKFPIDYPEHTMYAIFHSKDCYYEWVDSEPIALDEQVIISSGVEASNTSDIVFHTKSDCDRLKHTYRGYLIRDSNYLDLGRYRVCKKCSGTALPTKFEEPDYKCSDCGNNLDSDGECGFCERFDAIHDVPSTNEIRV